MRAAEEREEPADVGAEARELEVAAERAVGVGDLEDGAPAARRAYHVVPRHHDRREADGIHVAAVDPREIVKGVRGERPVVVADALPDAHVSDAPTRIEGEVRAWPPADREERLGPLKFVGRDGIGAEVVVPEAEEFALGVELEPRFEEREEPVVDEMRGAGRQRQHLLPFERLGRLGVERDAAAGDVAIGELAADQRSGIRPEADFGKHCPRASLDALRLRGPRRRHEVRDVFFCRDLVDRGRRAG